MSYDKKYLRLDAMPGSHVDGAFDACVAAAKEHGITVKLDFNGTDIVAYPGTPKSEVERAYYKDGADKQEVYRAAKEEKQMDRMLAAVITTQAKRDWTHAQLRVALRNAMV